MAASPAAPAVRAHAGAAMPRIIYGTAWKVDRTADLVERAVMAGFRGIDTACQPKHYHEPGVGEALQRLATRHGLPRSQLWLQTKFTPLSGQDPKRVPYDVKAPLQDQVRQSFQASVSNLRTPYVDCLLLHSPLDSHDKTLTAWRAMEALVADGAAGSGASSSGTEGASSSGAGNAPAGALSLGISNLYDLKLLQQLYRDARIKPSVLQNRFYADSGYDRDVRCFCREHGIAYQSFWTLTANPKLLQSKEVAAAAARRGSTPEQVLYRFVMQLGCVPLNGTSSDQHMSADLQVLAWPELEAAEMQAIGRLIGEPGEAPAGHY